MKKIILLLFILLTTLLTQAQVSKTVNLATAGTLSTSLTANEKNTVTNLTILGTIDARDFLIMRDNMPLLAVLDISNVTISAYIGTQGTAGTTTITYRANDIPQYAFCNDTIQVANIKLTYVTLPSNITSLDDNAFQQCRVLNNITMPNSVCSIGSQTFYACSGLTNLTMSNSVTTIGDNAFEYCKGLTSVTIPNSVVEISLSAFYGCTGLTEFVVQTNNSNFASINGVLFNKNQTSLILYPWGKQGIYIIPNSVTSIGNYAFDGYTKLTSLAIPSSVTSIGDFAFEGCSGLTSITIPNSVTSIGTGAFFQCSGLTSITLPNSITSIDEEVFTDCTGLTGSLIIPNSVTSIENMAFMCCTRLTGTLPITTSVNSIGSESFVGYGGPFAVDANNLNYSSIDGVLFNKAQKILLQCPTSKKGSYNIPLTVTMIEPFAFYQCSGLTSVAIPNSVTSIGFHTFYGCSGLIDITIPSTIASIEEYAFENCTGLTSIYTNSILPIDLSSSLGVFNNVNKTTCTLYVPTGSKSAYQAAYQWKDFTHIVEITTAVPTVTNASVNAYPNPITEYFQVSGIKNIALIVLRDLTGKTLLTKQITGNENISVSSLPKGVYVLEVSTNDGAIEKKIVKD